MRRSEAIAERAIKSEWYYLLTGWVDMIKGGPGTMGPSPSGKTRVMKVRKNERMSGSSKPA